MITFFLNIIESVLNRYLNLDPETSLRLEKLSGKVFAIEWQGLGLTCYLQPHPSGIHLTHHYEGHIDTVLSGGPFSLLCMSLSQDTSKSFFAGNVKITGDVEAGQQLKALFDNCDIDWEEQLSHVTGDVMAHQIGKVLRSFFSWGRKTSDSLQQNASEYLQEELRYFPPREEVNDFTKAVDQLRDDAERLEARVMMLQGDEEDDPKYVEAI